MIDLSRRNFLIGFGAAALATRLPLIAQAEAVSTAQSAGAFDYRSLFEVMIGFDDVPAGGPDQFAVIDLMRNNTAVLHMPMNVRNMLRWVAVPDGELIYLKNDVLQFICEPGHSDLNCSIIYDTKPRSDPYSKAYMERFAWKDGVLASQMIEPLSPSIEGTLRNDPNYVSKPYEWEDDYEMDDDDRRKIYG